MTPKHLRQELVNAYEGHDREGFDRALDRMDSMLAYAGPVDKSRQRTDAPDGFSCARGTCLCATDAQRSMCYFRRAG